ncbi:hypothetical protein LAZ67_2003934 [Cordylochernes scorpioides]|uniref:Major facilitator superfamily (MFS) profile domain-containing protein n=1 Tax=Cordylochernes scorpioides TaxID=51811 RepID=A0ABY6K6A4_9ARAC|nr:hypothetical protein LAZ67_2003934 [Cordylochernes scorpioides]
MTVLGLLRTSGLLYVALVNSFGLSREETTWPFSLNNSLMYLLGPLASILNQYFSLRQLIFFGLTLSSASIAFCFLAEGISQITILYGAIHGFGISLVFTLNPVVTNQYFVKHRTVASGVAFAGACIGSMVFSPVMEYLIAEFDIRSCFLLISAFYMQALVGSSLFFTPPWLRKNRSKTVRMSNIPEIQQSETTGKICKIFSEVLANLKRIKNIFILPIFGLISFTYSNFCNAYLIFLTLLVDQSRDKGLSEGEMAMLIPVYSAADLIGRLLVGWIVDLGLVSRPRLVTASFLGFGLGMASLSWVTWGLVYCVAVTGVATGALVVNFPVLMAEYLGLSRMTTAMGLANFITGIVVMGRPKVVGG